MEKDITKDLAKSVNPVNELSYSTGSKVIYEWENDSGKDPATNYGTSKVYSDFELINWGKKNCLPDDHLATIFANENKPQIISNRIALNIGKGVHAFERVYDENGKESIRPADNEEIRNFLRVCNPFTLESYNDFVEQALFDDEAFANPFCSIMLNREGTKAVSIKSLDATKCRIGKHKDTGELALMQADWTQHGQEVTDADVEILPFFDPLNPTAHFEFALHLNQVISGQAFYSIVPWNGTKSWAEISQLIPKFHLAGLKNGSYIRYHVKIPVSFLNKFDPEKRPEMKAKIQDDIDSFLSGADNAHKSFYNWVEDLGGNPQEWKIDTVAGELKDDSYLGLDDHADKKQSRGHDIHPILSNLEIAGNLSSGSEVMQLLNFHIAYKTQRQRERMLFPLKVIGMINGWPSSIEFGFKDVQFTTTDKNPTGQQNSTTE
jgi:hypothetical protein